MSVAPPSCDAFAHARGCGGLCLQRGDPRRGLNGRHRPLWFPGPRLTWNTVRTALPRSVSQGAWGWAFTSRRGHAVTRPALLQGHVEFQMPGWPSVTVTASRLRDR